LQLQKHTYNMIGLKFEFSGTRAPHRNRKVKGRSKPSTEESRLCLMTQELCMKFEMDFKTITIATDVCFTIHRIRASGKMCVVRSNKTTYVMLPHLIKKKSHRKIWRRSCKFVQFWDPWHTAIQDCKTEQSRLD
jgi:hypothetical protein